MSGAQIRHAHNLPRNSPAGVPFYMKNASEEALWPQLCRMGSGPAGRYGSILTIRYSLS